jgi:outer membrane protein assembly factor BamB
MAHWIRWIIVTPVVMLVLGSVMTSCGSNNGCFGSIDTFGNFVTGVCPGPTGTPGYALESINICEIFATPSPTGIPSPTPTSKHPKPTPTATETACTASTPAAVTTTTINGILRFEAQGVFSKKNSAPSYLDITNSPNTFWGSSPAGIVVNPSLGNGGVYQGQATGCTCISASSTSIQSLEYAIQVNPTTDCPPCPTPTATPTATATPAIRGSAAMDYVMPTAEATVTSPTALWTYQSEAPAAGPITAGTHGEAYFITTAAILHAIDSHGRRIFDRPAGGTQVAVAPDGTIIVPGTTDWLYGLTPRGIPRWKLEIGSSGVPLAADDAGAYVSADQNLISVSANGRINWSIPAAAASAGAIIPGGVAVASEGGAVSAYSTTGTMLWSFSPDGGFTGELVASGSSVYCGSRSGALYAIDSDTGARDWSVAGSGLPVAGPVVDTLGQIYFGAGALYAVDSAGAPRWIAKAYPPWAGDLAVDGAGDIFVAAADGTITKIGANGTAGWSSHSAGKVTSLAASSTGAIFVASSDGRVSALK